MNHFSPMNPIFDVRRVRHTKNNKSVTVGIPRAETIANLIIFGFWIRSPISWTQKSKNFWAGRPGRPGRPAPFHPYAPAHLDLSWPGYWHWFNEVKAVFKFWRFYSTHMVSVLKRLKFEYRINIKYMLHKYHMGRAAAGACRQGATHVVFIWHIFDINSVSEFQPF